MKKGAGKKGLHNMQKSLGRLGKEKDSTIRKNKCPDEQVWCRGRGVGVAYLYLYNRGGIWKRGPKNPFLRVR